MNLKRALFAFSTLLAALAAPGAALAVTYALVDLGHGPNGKDAVANGANNSVQAGSFLFELVQRRHQ